MAEKSSTGQYDDLTNAELRRMLSEKTTEINRMRNECELIERYLTKMDPNLLIGITEEMCRGKSGRRIKFAAGSEADTQSVSSATNIKSGGSSMRDSFNRSSMRSSTRSSMRSSMRGSIGPRLSVMSTGSQVSQTERSRMQRTVNHRTKFDICERITGDIQNTMDEYLRKHRPILPNQQAVIDERKMLMRDLQNDLNELEGRMSSSKPNESILTAFVTNWLKRTNMAIEKTRLRISCQHQRNNSIRQQISVNCQLKAVFLPVDYLQLEIDVSEKRKLLHERNQQFVILKNVSAAEKSQLASDRKFMLNCTDRMASMDYELTSIRGKRAAVADAMAMKTQDIDRQRDELRAMKH